MRLNDGEAGAKTMEGIARHRDCHSKFTVDDETPTGWVPMQAKHAVHAVLIGSRGFGFPWHERLVSARSCAIMMTIVFLTVVQRLTRLIKLADTFN